MRLVAVAVALVVAVACNSPEATRARGAAGADQGNRTQVVEIHGETDPGHKTPLFGKAADKRAILEYEPASEKGK